ncbi:MAG: hypothetical protein DMG49_21075 [Acidobacteria bacterium]|nr:MAG: hypothetical protein DMG49_21075 [Acidobacteriota bacterium]
MENAAILLLRYLSLTMPKTIHGPDQRFLSCRPKLHSRHKDNVGGIRESLRLNYATELRYGALVDIAQRVYAGRPVPLSCSDVE